MLITLSSMLGPIDFAFCLRKAEAAGGPAVWEKDAFDVDAGCE